LHVSDERAEEVDMEAIRHRVGIDAPIGAVYEQLATRDGLASWWTRHVEGESRVDGDLEFWFGGNAPAAVMKVVELAPPRAVAWRCTDGADEWRDTTLRFDLREEDGQTTVLFTHDRWREPVEFLHHCSTRWAYFLFSLKAGLEGGKATPWPEDAKIDNWG
jgi:uncharacterized protein YndB with AHSA1/START domain